MFFHQQSPCTWSLPCLFEQNTLWAKCGGVDPPNFTSESSNLAIMMHTRCRQLLLLMPEQGGRTSQERWTCQTKIKFKTKTGLAEEGGTTIGSATNGDATTRILIFKSEPREDACLSLAKGTTILKRPINASTTGSQSLKRELLPYKVHYIRDEVRHMMNSK